MKILVYLIIAILALHIGMMLGAILSIVVQTLSVMKTLKRLDIVTDRSKLVYMSLDLFDASIKFNLKYILLHPAFTLSVNDEVNNIINNINSCDFLTHESTPARELLGYALNQMQKSIK